MDIRASNKEIGGHKFGQLGYGKDMIDENGSVTFAQADEGDVYYNGAAVATMPLQTAAAASISSHMFGVLTTTQKG